MIKRENVEFDFMVYDLTKRFQIGDRTIISRVEHLERLGYIENEMGVLKWKR